MSGPMAASFGLEAAVMEHRPAGSLRQLMDDGPLRRDELRLIVTEIAEALAARDGIDPVHRELKPEIILVRQREPLELELDEFGTASPATNTQDNDDMLRDTRYSAPETLSGVLDSAAVWWSLGIILVELLTGSHPFKDLTGTDITHRLATTGVDLSNVSDPDWRKLCRGLLLRDPRQRWGGDEVQRWLAGDITLLAPQDDFVAPGAHHLLPFRVEDTLCHTPEELAAALATHWDRGRKDLMSGQITTWAEEELEDPDLVHFLQNLLGLRDVKDDLRLLRLILYLAPTSQPAWRGHSLTLQGLSAQAARAVQGDFPAIDWVVSIFAQKSLRELSPKQFPAEAALAARWEEQHAHCMQLWQETTHARTDLRSEQTSIQGISNFDALVYGEPIGLSKPSPFKLLPMLLLALTDANYGSDLCKQIRTRAADWLAHNPWLEHLLSSDEAAAWVMAYFLLPYARDEASSAQKRLQLEAHEEAARFVELVERTNDILVRLHNTCATLGAFSGSVKLSHAADVCTQLLELVAAARAQGVPNDNPLMRTLRRAEPITLRIQDRLHTLAQATPFKALFGSIKLRQAIRDLGNTLPTRVPAA